MFSGFGYVKIKAIIDLSACSAKAVVTELAAMAFANLRVIHLE